MSLRISSLQNPRVKAVVRLRERKERDLRGLMLIEGCDELALALDCGLCPVELYLHPEGAERQEMILAERCAAIGSEVIEVSRPVLEKLAYREHPGALLAVAKTPRCRLDELTLSKEPLLLVAQSLEKPGNLGAILRSADAVGVDAVIVCDGRTDLFNPNVVRASKGTIFQVPVAATHSDELLPWLSERSIPIVAASPAGDRDFWQSNLRGALAIAVGAEREGLSDTWLEQAQSKVRIPMCGQVNSLNVAQAATLLLYESLRQRRNE